MNRQNPVMKEKITVLKSAACCNMAVSAKKPKRLING
jgi:hypothetical protein